MSASETPGLATFAYLAAANTTMGKGVDRILNQSEEPEERRMWNVVYGAREDCLALLQLFEAKDSLRFQDFAACWRELMFSHMLSGRSIMPERVEYLQKFVALVVRLFAAGQDITRRVGALYLLYGIYMKLGRAERTLVTIRVTPHVWLELKQLRQQSIEHNHHDVLYVIDKLMFVSAFSFVATEVEMAPDLVYRAARNGLDGSGDEADDQQSPLQEFLDDGGLLQLSTLHNKYEAIKQKVFKGAASRRLPSLGLDVVPVISSRLNAIAKGNQPVDRPAEDQSTQPTTLSGRQGARARAFAQYQQGPAPRPVPGAQQSPASSEEEEEAAPPFPPKRGRGRGRGGGGGSAGVQRAAPVADSRGGGRAGVLGRRGRSRGRGRQ